MNTPATKLDPEKARRLAQLLDGVAALANRFKPLVRNLTLLALVAGASLALEVRYAAHLGAGVSIVIGVLLLVPCAVLAMLWWLLSDLSDLPGQVRRVYGGLRDVARGEPGGGEPAGIGGVFRIGGSLREAASLAVDAGGLAGAITGAMLLANPLFLLAIAMAIVGAFVLTLLAAAGGLYLM